MELKGKKVLITGGAGLVGSHIADLLIDEGCSEIIAVDNLVRGHPENLTTAMQRGPVRLVEGDIRNYNLMERLIKQTDIVFHQAALRITLCADSPRQALEVMVDATFDLLELCAKHKVKKVIAASTASIYGMADEFPITERHHPYNNRTLYGAAKSFNEGLLRSFHEMYSLDYVALRYFNVYGPRMDTHGVYTEVLIRWMERIAAGEPPLIFGDGNQTMDFIYISEIARANILAAKADVTDMVFNVASGKETSLNELATTLLQVMGSDLQPEYGPERKVNPVQRRLADISAAQRLLGFKSAVSLEEGLKRLVAWWQMEQNPDPVELPSSRLSSKVEDTGIQADLIYGSSYPVIVPSV